MNAVAIWRITVMVKITAKNGGKGTGDSQAVSGGRCQADLVAKSGKDDSRIKQMIAIISASTNPQLYIVPGGSHLRDPVASHFVALLAALVGSLSWLAGRS